MQLPGFFMEKSRSLVKIAIACLLLFTFAISSFAQYRGAPVKKERLIKALRSKQLKSEDIVTIIRYNGVDFKLTPEVRQALVAAGARPEVILAVANNLRPSPGDGTLYAQKDVVITYPTVSNAPDYEDLLEKAIDSYEKKNNSINAVRYLKTAIELKPGDAKAYQMLSFVNLYGLSEIGLSNIGNTHKYMRESISKGGSAVFRVYYDDDGDFRNRRSGSFYISSDRIRFESDNNSLTFESSLANLQKIETDKSSETNWKNHPVFNIYLKIGTDTTKFRFAPITGKFEESNLAAFLISEKRPGILKDKTSNFSLGFSKMKTIFESH